MIDASYFTGQILIPNLTGQGPVVAANIDNLQDFIERYEPDYLRKVLGDDLAAAFMEGIKNYKSGNHRVRFFDIEGNLLSEQWVKTGMDAKAPEPPEFEHLTFVEWNNDFTNVQHDVDTGTIYNTDDGRTWLQLIINVITGYQPSISVYKHTTDKLTIDWGDGTSDNTTVQGGVTIQKSTPYTEDFNGWVSIDCKGGYELQDISGYGDSFMSGYHRALEKLYFGNKCSALSSYFAIGMRNLQTISFGESILDFENASECLLGNTSLKALIFPKGISDFKGYDFAAELQSCLIIILPLDFSGKIGNTAFQNSYNGSIIIPYGVNNLGVNSLRSDTAIEYVLLPEIPPSGGNAALEYFGNSNVHFFKIYVPDDSVTAYKAQWDEWEDYIFPISSRPAPQPETRWITLYNLLYSKLSPVAEFIYYWYVRDKMSNTTVIGETIAAAENAHYALNTDKMKRAYNDAVTKGYEIQRFVRENIKDYPEFNKKHHFSLTPINEFNI